MLFSCKKQVKESQIKDIELEIEYILKDSTINVRALALRNEEVIIATAKGETLIKKPRDSVFTELFKKDTIYEPNFRALTCTNSAVFTLCVENPALLYKNGTLVYKEVGDKVFYDSMKFWNDEEGIAIGDSTDDCLSVLITRDSGDTWQKIPCESLPKGSYGAFAASDTNITIVGNYAWVATGGKNGAIIYSADKGVTWTRIAIPIINDLETSGLYSIDFYDEKIGFAIGGDYSKPEENVKNKIRTFDGGKTWSLVADGKAPGYRSCVQFFPSSEGKKLIAVGFKGIDYSSDFGETWQHLSDTGFYTIRFLNDSIAYAAGDGLVAKLKFK